MSPKHLARMALLLVLLLLLWGAAALARRQNHADALDRFTLPRIARDQVDSVRIERTGDTVTLVRRDTSTWQVNGHLASIPAVNDLMGALADTAPSAELVAERATSHAELGVDSAKGARVRVFGAGKVLADLVAGHRTTDLNGVYLRFAGKDETYGVRGRFAEILDRRSDDWRDHRIATVMADSVGSLEINRGRRSYAALRGPKGWTFSTGAPADSAGVADLLGAFSQVAATGFATQAEADSATFNPPDRRARLARKDGSSLLTLVFDSTKSGYWVRPDTSRTVYRIENWTADRLTPPDSALRSGKKGA